MKRLLRIVIEILVLAAIVFMPMAFGGSPRWTWLVFELTVAFALVLWMLRMAIERRVAWTTTPLNLLLILLLLFIFFQCVPLPTDLMKRLQPNTVRTYLAGPPPVATGAIPTEGRRTVPVTLNRARTRDMLFLYAGYVGLFLLIINNVTHRAQLGRLIGVVIAVGVLVSLSGLATFKQDQRLLYRYWDAGGEGEAPWFLNPYASPEDSAGYGFVFQVREGDALPPRTPEEQAAFSALSFADQQAASAERERLAARYGPDWYVAKVHAGDVFGGFQSSNSAATVLGMSVMMAMGVLFAYVSTRRTEWGRSGGLIYTREGNVTVLILCLLALMLLAAALTKSRAAIALIPAFLLLGVVFNAFTRSVRAGLIALMVLAVLVVVPVLVIGRSAIVEYVDTKAAWYLNPWEDLRLLARQSTWDIIRDFPLFGSGLGTFANIYPSYKINGPMLYFTHCDPLQWMAEAGLVGTILALLILLTGFLTVIWGWLRLKDRFSRRMLVGGALACAFFLVHGWVDFPLAIPGVVVIFVAVASIVFILSRDQVSRHEEQDFIF